MVAKKKVSAFKSSSLAALRKEHSENLVDPVVYDNVEVIPSGSLVIDTLSGIGGYPCGRLVELWGGEGVSKTTLALLAAAQCQKLGKAVVYFDFENSFSNAYAKALGVDMYDKDLFHYFTDITFEEAEPILRAYAMGENIGLIIIDSITAMTPQDSLEGGKSIGLLARNLSRFLGGFVKLLGKNNAACVATNQVRLKIATSKYERTQECSTGGKALQFYNSIKIKLKSRLKLKGMVPNLITGIMEEEVIKVLVRATVEKNRFSKPFVSGDYWVKFGEGVDNGGTIFDMAAARDLFHLSGSWVTFQFPWDGKPSGEFKVQGLDNVREMVSGDQGLQKVCLEALNMSGTVLTQGSSGYAIDEDGIDEDE